MRRDDQLGNQRTLPTRKLGTSIRTIVALCRVKVTDQLIQNERVSVMPKICLKTTYLKTWVRTSSGAETMAGDFIQPATAVTRGDTAETSDPTALTSQRSKRVEMSEAMTGPLRQNSQTRALTSRTSRSPTRDRAASAVN